MEGMGVEGRERGGRVRDLIKGSGSPLGPVSSARVPPSLGYFQRPESTRKLISQRSHPAASTCPSPSLPHVPDYMGGGTPSTRLRQPREVGVGGKMRRGGRHNLFSC